MRIQDAIDGFAHLEAVGKCFGENCTFYTGMIEGINTKMNIDILEYLRDPKYREIMYAEVILQWILDGKTVDIDEADALLKNKKMVDMIRKYLDKTENAD